MKLLPQIYRVLGTLQPMRRIPIFHEDWAATAFGAKFRKNLLQIRLEYLSNVVFLKESPILPGAVKPNQGRFVVVADASPNVPLAGILSSFLPLDLVRSMARPTAA